MMGPSFWGLNSENGPFGNLREYLRIEEIKAMITSTKVEKHLR